MTMELNLKDIIIPEKFKQSIPNDYKIANVNIDYDNGEDIGKEIIVNTAGELIDGYIRYLVLLYRGVERAEITIANKVHYKMFRQSMSLENINQMEKPMFGE